MTDQNPRLAVVSGDAEVSPDSREGAASKRRGRNPLSWIMAGALVLSALGWFLQAREARELAASLEVTQSALGRAQAELRAYDQHLSEVGDQLGVLGDQLDSLQALVAEGPRHGQEP